MKFNVKNLFMGVVLIIVLAVVFLRGDQLVELGETMKQGSPLPLVAAILTQLGKYFAQSFAYSRSFAAVGERMEPKSTLPLVFGTFFMNTIAPSMNLAGTTLVVDDARRRGIPAGKATGAALLMQITIDGAFSTLMVCAFVFLAVTVGLSPVWFLMGMVVMCLVGTMVALLILAHKKPDLLMRLLRPAERVSRKVVGRVRKKPLEPWAERIAQAFSEAAGMIGHSPKPTLQAYGCSLIASLCELSCFALVGIGFGVDTAPALVCGYVVATLFAMISVTPQGVGVVEAAVVVAFTSFGESAAAGYGNRPGVPRHRVLDAVHHRRRAHQHHKGVQGRCEAGGVRSGYGRRRRHGCYGGALGGRSSRRRGAVQACGGFAFAYGGFCRCACDAWWAASCGYGAAGSWRGRSGRCRWDGRHSDGERRCPDGAFCAGR